MQNGTGAIRAVAAGFASPARLRVVRAVETLSIIGLAAAYFISITFSCRIGIQAWWYLLLILAFGYFAFRLILGSDRSQTYFLILLPLGAGSIWQFAGHLNIDFSPLLFITIAVLFYCFHFFQAVGGALLLTGVAGAQVVQNRTDLSVLAWLPVFGLVWGAMFWLMQQEGERFRNRITSMESRARGLMGSMKPEEETGNVFGDLSEETKVAKAVASIFRIDNLVKMVLEIIHDIMHPHSCFFFFLDQEKAYMKLMVYCSRSRYFDREAIVELDSEGLLGWVIRSKQLMRHEKLPRSSQYQPYYSARERILSCVFIPVIRQDVVEGILGVDSRRSHSFGTEEEAQLQVFANLIGDVVEVFRNYQQRESRAGYIEAFYKAVKQLLETKLDIGQRLDVLIQISHMVKKFDELAVAVPDDSGKFFVRKAEGTFFPKILGATIHPESFLSQYTRCDAELAVVDAPQSIAGSEGLFTPVEPNFKIVSFLVVPLPMENRIMGLLVLGSRRKSYFTDSDIYFFKSLAAQFGFSLENALNAERIERLAITDGLTGIYNHRYFQDTLIKEIKRSRREPSPFSLLMADIDHFKKFNDTYGHQAGDEILKGVARLLKEEAREVDPVARYGGEEFVVLLLGCDVKTACRIAERIRKACAKKQFAIRNRTVSVTLSIGIASYPAQGDQSEQLIAAADKALYRAKEAGRNRVMVAGEAFVPD
ncbi:diguanylate cyclase [bacterium]|nr:diguanylate cyclase [candidate division CSSED10-310 bacterium]